MNHLQLELASEEMKKNHTSRILPYFEERQYFSNLIFYLKLITPNLSEAIANLSKIQI